MNELHALEEEYPKGLTEQSAGQTPTQSIIIVDCGETIKIVSE